MTWLKGLWKAIVTISKSVLDVFARALSSFVAQEAAGYYQTVLGLVSQAETQYGAGAGQVKYDWVISQLKAALGQRFNATPLRVFDFAIHMAVSELSQRSQ